MTIASINFQMLTNAGYPPAHYAAGNAIAVMRALADRLPRMDEAI